MGDSGSSAARATVLVRIVKLLRMIKLARVLKASRVMQRVLMDVVMNKWEFTYGFIKMIKLFLVLTLYAHWQACAWGLLSSYMTYEDEEDEAAAGGAVGWEPRTWIEVYAASHERTWRKPPEPLEIYVAALYWSTMTLTGIGYGEMTPVNTVERAMCSVYMLVSGAIWTWAIGSVTAIATTLDPSTALYQTTMDQLNYFMCVHMRASRRHPP